MMLYDIKIVLWNILQLDSNFNMKF